jgi:hypothetical protein
VLEEITSERQPLRRVRERRWSKPGHLLQPIADAIAELVCGRGLPAHPRVRGDGVHVDVLRPHEGPRAALVQHGGVRKPRQSRRTSRESRRQKTAMIRIAGS